MTVNMSIAHETKLDASGPYPEDKNPFPHWQFKKPEGENRIYLHSSGRG